MSDERRESLPNAPSAPRPSLGALVVILGMAALAAVWILRSRDVWIHRSRESSGAIGQPLPELRLTGLTGGAPDVTLADLRGKVFVLNFWGTWCGPCVAEFPHMVELANRFADRDDFRLLAVSSTGGADTQDELAQLRDNTAAFLAARMTDLPTYADVDAVTRLAMAPVAKFSGYPTTLIVDRQGVIRGLWVGYGPGVETKQAALVEQLLGEPATTTAQNGTALSLAAAQGQSRR